MNIKGFAIEKVRSTKIGVRLYDDKEYRMIAKAVLSLIFNVAFAFYNGILGHLSSSVIFITSAVYYLTLSFMRFAVVLSRRRFKEKGAIGVIGAMLIILCIVFSAMVFVSMRDKTASVYGTVTMITIATFTFSKITAAVISAIKHKKDKNRLVFAVNAIRYSEVAVSLLTMQQSMLVSFGEGGDSFAVILNAMTGAAVCLFILMMGILTLKKQKGKLR